MSLYADSSAVLKRYLDDGAVPAALQLTESRTTSAGIVIGVYAVGGPPSYGSFALDDEEVAAG